MLESLLASRGLDVVSSDVWNDAIHGRERTEQYRAEAAVRDRDANDLREGPHVRHRHRRVERAHDRLHLIRDAQRIARGANDEVHAARHEVRCFGRLWIREVHRRLRRGVEAARADVVGRRPSS
jgi:hypothetical protein